MEHNEFDPAQAEDNTLNINRRPREKKTDFRLDILSYLHDVVHTLAGVLLLFLLLFRIVIVNGPSMRDTLVHGDYVILINNIFYQEKKPGDIVVISKDSFKEGEPIIKRIIATEGQQVDIDFANGVVYVDGSALDEPYTRTETNLYEGVSFPLTVAEGCYFVMGDNRNDSKDSRSTEIGMIDNREILGKAVFLLLPGENPETEEHEFDRIGVLS